MTLFADVVDILNQKDSSHAVIGAAALAVLGSNRSTLDIDLLTTDRAVLHQAYWSEIEAAGSAADIRFGDISDPLVGVVRLTRAKERPVDIIVGEAPWQEQVLADAQSHVVGGTDVPVVDQPGFVLLKVYAGGPQDLWDIEQLLAVAQDRDDLSRQVTERIGDLPPRCGHLWDRVITNVS